MEWRFVIMSKIPVLKIKDEKGNLIPINAIRGASAYEQAKEGGYKGTKEEFLAFLNGIAGDSTHYVDYNNPHKVTAEQAGAIPEAYYASDDLNTELQQGGSKMKICSYHSGTLNTPYKEGLTVFAHGLVITNACDSNYGTQLCIPSGEDALYVRRLNGQGVSKWSKMADNEQVNTHISDSTKHIRNLENDVLVVGNTLIADGSSKSVFVGNGEQCDGDEEWFVEDSVAVGHNSCVDAGSVAVGARVYSSCESVSIGNNSSAENEGVAVGSGAYASNLSVAVGDGATALNDAIQLGRGQNEAEKTLQVYDYTLMLDNGKIHSDRLPFASGSYEGTNTYGVNNPNTLTFDFVPKFVIVSQRGERNATGGGCFIWINSGSTLNFINNGSTYWVHPTLTDKTLSWYCAESASYQLNSSNYTYDYFAWG